MQVICSCISIAAHFCYQFHKCKYKHSDDPSIQRRNGEVFVNDNFIEKCCWSVIDGKTALFQVGLGAEQATMFRYSIADYLKGKPGR